MTTEKVTTKPQGLYHFPLPAWNTDEHTQHRHRLAFALLYPFGPAVKDDAPVELGRAVVRACVASVLARRPEDDQLFVDVESEANRAFVLRDLLVNSTISDESVCIFLEESVPNLDLSVPDEDGFVTPVFRILGHFIAHYHKMAELGQEIHLSYQKAGALWITAKELYYQELQNYGPENDAAYTRGELLMAAQAYMDAYVRQGLGGKDTPPEVPTSWPWDPELFKAATPGVCLRKAAALLICEAARTSYSE